MDFDRMPMLHHNPDGIDFGHRVRLDSYDYAPSVRGGQVLTVTLSWTQQDPYLVADLRLVSPADAHRDLAPAPPPLASCRAYVEGSETQHGLDVPADVAGGMYYLALRVFDGDREVQALSARGDTLGTSYLRPVWVDNPRPAERDERPLAWFGDRILLRDNVRVSIEDGYWDVALTWQARAPIPLNYTCSLRMLDAHGSPIAQRDFEGGPGYGFWPTSAWPVGEWLTDRLRIAVPPQARAEEAVALSVVLYDRSQEGFPAAGTVIVPLIEREHRYQVPAAQHPVEAVYGEQLRLLGYDLAQDSASLRLTLHWQAVARMTEDYAVFVHLYDPETEEIVAQSDARPLNGAYPTHWWREGEVVSDPVFLPLVEVPEGSYRLAVGLYNAQGDRLPLVRVSGDEAPGGRLILEQVISIPHSSGT
jgi:hypothetical protein